MNMSQRIVLYLMVSFITVACQPRATAKVESSDINKTIEEKIADHTIALPDSCSFSFLDKIVKDKRLLILGEAGHYDGTSYAVRTEMVKYLSEKHGFNVIALEGLSFLKSCFIMGGERMTKTESDKFIMKTMLADRESRPILDIIYQNKIDLLGIEPNNCYNFMELNPLVDRYDLEKDLSINWEVFKEEAMKTGALHIRFSDYPYYVDTTATQYCMQSLNKIKNWLKKQLQRKDHPDRAYFQAVLQSINGVKANLKGFLIKVNGPTIQEDFDRLTTLNNYRDEQMASNIIWYMDHHPDQKMIVWCANFHGMRDVSQCSHPEDSLVYIRQKLMGERLAEHFEDQLYSLAFTDLYRDGNKDFAGALEQELGKKGMKFGFTDFTFLRYQEDFFNKWFNCSAIGRKNGNWMYIWDGLYYIRYQKLSEKDSVTQAQGQ